MCSWRRKCLVILIRYFNSPNVKYIFIPNLFSKYLKIYEFWFRSNQSSWNQPYGWINAAEFVITSQTKSILKQFSLFTIKTLSQFKRKENHYNRQVTVKMNSDQSMHTNYKVKNRSNVDNNISLNNKRFPNMKILVYIKSKCV
jgi:hypothetical protein